MNTGELFGIIITSVLMGVRFIPAISLSELFGGRFTPFIVKSSLVAILGFFRYFISARQDLVSVFEISYLISEFGLGLILASPFILLSKYLISLSSVAESLFGGLGVLNSQGIFDERNSALEMFFEMIIIMLIFISDSHLLLLKLLFGSHNLSLSDDAFRRIIHEVIICFNSLSKNSIGYFAPVIY
ncbi:MAG: hypothetical protein N3B13_03615, partial [Deltaproteobacteria bacterium]|nr:hypothetical protein [Deltaproteobacteria bacterium]